MQVSIMYPFNIIPGELAFQVLQRAGEDLAKFDQFFSGQKNNNR